MSSEGALTIVAAHHEPELTVARTLIVEYVEWLGIDLSFQDIDAELGALPGAYQPQAGALLLARVDGAAAGCVALRPLAEAGVCEMKRMWVRDPFRGRGVGRALAEAVIAAAVASGYEHMRLDTLTTMAGANALYESLGFRDIPRYRENPLAEARFLELRLTPDRRPGAPPARSR